MVLKLHAFFETALALAREAFEERYFLKALGIDFDQVVLKVAEVVKLTPDQAHGLREIAPERPGQLVALFWAHRKLGITTTEIVDAAQDKPTGGNSLF